MASAGAIDGATGMPSVGVSAASDENGDEEGVWRSSGSRGSIVRVLLANHRRSGEIHSRTAQPFLEQVRETPPMVVRHLSHSLDELHLHGGRRISEHRAALRRQRDLNTTAIMRRGGACYEAAVHETTHDDGNRALMGGRPRGQLIQRFDGTLGELLQHEELSQADPGAKLDRARIDAERADDASHRVHSPRNVCLLFRREFFRLRLGTHSMST